MLDTHVLIWAVIEPARLKPGMIDTMLSSDAVLFSVASIWEMSIKASLGRSNFMVSVDEVVENARSSGFIELPVRTSEALAVANLPLHHRDPFDRLLVAQAITLSARLLTADTQLTRYSELVTLV